MNVNQKGNIGLIEVIRDLTQKGYECFTPFHDYSAVDLIIMNKNNELKKLQIKYREFNSDVTTIEFVSVVNGKRIPIDLNAIDGWAIYIPEVEKVCYISKKQIPKDTRSFRIRKNAGANTINVDKLKSPVYTELLSEECLWWGA
jgi:PD-(D/E)XK endonuclease